MFSKLVCFTLSHNIETPAVLWGGDDSCHSELVEESQRHCFDACLLFRTALRSFTSFRMTITFNLTLHWILRFVSLRSGWQILFRTSLRSFTPSRMTLKYNLLYYTIQYLFLYSNYIIFDLVHIWLLFFVSY